MPSQDAPSSTRPGGGVPFPFDEAQLAFERSLREFVDAAAQAERDEFSSPENTLRYRHGVSWRTHYSDRPDEVSKMEVGTSEMRVPFERIAAGDVRFMQEKITGLVEGMHRAVMRTLYGAIGEAAEAAGQTIDAAQEGSFAAAFVKALRKMEFSVGRDGAVSLPQLHMGPGAFEAIKKDLASEAPGFEAEVKRITEEKKAAALAREAERRGRFVRCA